MAALDLNTVRSTIEGRLQTEMEGNSPFVPVVFHNMPYTPTPGTSWCQCSVSFSTSDYLTMGDDSSSSNNMTGLLSIDIYSAKGVGTGDNLTIGKRVRDLYNRITVSGVHFDSPTGPEVMASPQPEGYFLTQVRCTFEVFEDL